MGVKTTPNDTSAHTFQKRITVPVSQEAAFLINGTKPVFRLDMFGRESFGFIVRKVVTLPESYPHGLAAGKSFNGHKDFWNHMLFPPGLIQVLQNSQCK
ncbi:unnamed protein product [marine sediment metagenome]|uniref:Uncharacterized protein n=1 Tax=marine sediment metagenome TaxID=412755 RepID=X1JRT8_9ZZZZ